MANSEPFGFDPEDLDRFVRKAGEQLRGALGQFGGMSGSSGQRAGWSNLFDEFSRRPRSTPERETTGETGDGVWAIYTVDGDGAAHVEQVYSSELDALRGNKHNTAGNRKVRFLPYGIAVSVLDTPEETSTS